MIDLVADVLGEIWQATVDVVGRKWGIAAGAAAFVGPIVIAGLTVWWFLRRSLG